MLRSKIALSAVCAVACLLSGPALAQDTGGRATAGGEVPKPPSQPSQPSQPPQPSTCSPRVELLDIWVYLQRTHDADGDGRITEAEYTRGAVQFHNHDRDGDGAITAADFPAGRHWNGFAPGIVRRADRDGDGAVSAAEWHGFLSMLDADGDGVLTMAEFGKIAPQQITDRPELVALSFDQDQDGAIEVADFEQMFEDLDIDGSGGLDSKELRRNRPLGASPSRAALPKPGELAPDFELPRAVEPAETVALSSFRGERPVALIFGSYT